MGIPLEESKLKQMYCEDQHECLFLGGKPPTRPMKTFMTLDPKFQTFEALDPEEFELDAEVAANKQ